MRYVNKSIVAAAALIGIAGQALAADEVKIGFSATATGSNSTVGIVHRQVSEILPDTLGGLKVRWIFVDDATDPVAAVKNARKFVDEDRVDAIMGSSSVLTALPMFEVATASGTPQLPLLPAPLPEGKSDWLFNVAQPLPLMVAAVTADMKSKGLKTVAFIGFSDGWGDLNMQALKASAEADGIEILADERYARTDSSTTAQVLSVISTSPDAVYIGAANTAAALPHIALRDQGFEGPIYHSHGSVTRTFIEAGGAAVEGAIMPTSPLVVVDDLPDSHPSKKASLELKEKFKARWNEDFVQPFAGYSWDAMLLLDKAVEKAKAVASPGTAEFRKAIRDALEDGSETIGSSGTYSYVAGNHIGVDARARVMAVIKDGRFRLLD